MPAPTTTDEFLDLLRKSGVADEKRLDAYLARLRDAGALPAEPAKLAGLLVHQAAILTHFQAEQVLLGKWRRFTIGKYKVLERLGQGGMGSVYLCEHKLMRRRVAVKVLPTAKADDPSSLERFYREARAVAALDHPNIVRAYDIDQDGNLHFLVMEYVDGSSLQEIIKKAGPMDVTRAAHYMRQSALGLEHAHRSAGLVHRDIKPGNVLVDRTGTVKILDMGLARFFHDEEDMLTKKYDENVLGTADYLAPEQALDSHGVDIRADIYSLGATFYFCLTGRTPFTEGTVAQKLIWHQTRQPKAVRQLRAEVPEVFAGLIERMMAKDPGQRPQTPLEVAEALEPFTQEAIGPPPEEEMPKLSPAALGQTGGDSGSSVSTPALPSGGPSSGQRKNWKVPSTPGTRPPGSGNTPVRPASPGSTASPPPAPLKPSRPTPPSARAPAAPVTAAAPRKAAVPQSRRGVTAAPPAPAPDEEGAPWENLAPQTEEIGAHADTEPRQGRKSPSSAARRRPRLPLALDRKRVLIAAGVAAVVLAAGLVALAAWLLSRGGPAPAPTNAAGAVRQLLHVGENQKFKKVTQAINNAMPGDRIIVHGPVIEEELLFNGNDERRKNLTIEAEGDQRVVWRLPPGNAVPHLVTLNSAEGLKLRGFTFDGDNRCKWSVILLIGRCPGTTLEDVTVEGFTTTGVLIENCEGTEARPVTLANVAVTVPAGKNAEAALAFDLNPQIQPPANRFLQFINCQISGAFRDRVRNPDKIKDKDEVKGLPK